MLDLGSGETSPRGVKGLEQGLSQLKHSVCMCLRWLTASRPLGPDRRNQGSDLCARPKRPALCSSSILDLATRRLFYFLQICRAPVAPGLPCCDPLPLHKQHLPAIRPHQALSKAGTTLRATPTLRPCCL